MSYHIIYSPEGERLEVPFSKYAALIKSGWSGLPPGIKVEEPEVNPTEVKPARQSRRKRAKNLSI